MDKPKQQKSNPSPTGDTTKDIPDGTLLFVVCPMCGMPRSWKSGRHFLKGSPASTKFVQLRDGRGGRGSGFKLLEEASMAWAIQKKGRWLPILLEVKERCLELLTHL